VDDNNNNGNVNKSVGSANNNNVQEEPNNNNCASLKMEPLKGAGLRLDEGWVNPTTTHELWWPRDLTTLQVRPMLNVLFRNGIISYVSAGLDVRVPHHEDGGDVVSSWRNYGLNSQPIARIWTTLDAIAMEKLFHMETFIVQNDDEHEILFPSMYTQDVMQRVATFIAELDSLSPLAEGFHIASFPMMENWTDLPSPKAKESKKEEEEEKGDEDRTEAIYKVVCIATAEPFANKLLDMEEDLLTLTSTSVLEVVVSRTAKGGDSPYLTEPYKGLYLSS